MIQRVLSDLSDQNSRLHFDELSIILIISDEHVDKFLVHLRTILLPLEIPNLT